MRIIQTSFYFVTQRPGWQEWQCLRLDMINIPRSEMFHHKSRSSVDRIPFYKSSFSCFFISCWVSNWKNYHYFNTCQFFYFFFFPFFPFFPFSLFFLVFLFYFSFLLPISFFIFFYYGFLFSILNIFSTYFVFSRVWPTLMYSICRRKNVVAKNHSLFSFNAVQYTANLYNRNVDSVKSCKI